MTVYLPLYSTNLSVSFFYEVPLESIYNPHIIEITTISFYAVSASPCQCLIRPVQRPKVSWFLGSFFIGFQIAPEGVCLGGKFQKSTEWGIG